MPEMIEVTRAPNATLHYPDPMTFGQRAQMHTLQHHNYVRCTAKVKCYGNAALNGNADAKFASSRLAVQQFLVPNARARALHLPEVMSTSAIVDGLQEMIEWAGKISKTNANKIRNLFAIDKHIGRANIEPFFCERNLAFRNISRTFLPSHLARCVTAKWI